MSQQIRGKNRIRGHIESTQPAPTEARSIQENLAQHSVPFSRCHLSQLWSLACEQQKQMLANSSSKELIGIIQENADLEKENQSQKEPDLDSSKDLSTRNSWNRTLQGLPAKWLSPMHLPTRCLYVLDSDSWVHLGHVLILCWGRGREVVWDFKILRSSRCSIKTEGYMFLN